MLAGAFATWRNLKLAQESLRVSQEGQITDRFTKAIEQLGAVDASGTKKLEVRLGGIYALERIANQSERDHWPIVEVLSTYVRENAPRKPHESTQEDQASTRPPHPAADIQAILTVLGRRDRRYEREGQVLDLTRTDIRGADLCEAKLSEAILFQANLSGAMFNGANLSDAKLGGSNLSRAYLFKTNLGRANLTRANLVQANLSEADLHEAKLSRANLTGANLTGADLSGAKHLNQMQVDTAIGNSDTQLPENLHKPESWEK